MKIVQYLAILSLLVMLYVLLFKCQISKYEYVHIYKIFKQNNVEMSTHIIPSFYIQAKSNHIGTIYQYVLQGYKKISTFLVDITRLLIGMLARMVANSPSCSSNWE